MRCFFVQNCINIIQMLICFLLAIAAALECRHLRKNQFICELPQIDIATQEYAGCPREEKLRLRCAPHKGINCTEDSGLERQFDGSSFAESIEIFAPCRWTNKKYYATAVVLSIFLGILGIGNFIQRTFVLIALRSFLSRISCHRPY
jgi:hypothetical protein